MCGSRFALRILFEVLMELFSVALIYKAIFLRSEVSWGDVLYSSSKIKIRRAEWLISIKDSLIWQAHNYCLFANNCSFTLMKLNFLNLDDWNRQCLLSLWKAKPKCIWLMTECFEVSLSIEMFYLADAVILFQGWKKLAWKKFHYGIDYTWLALPLRSLTCDYTFLYFT